MTAEEFLRDLALRVRQVVNDPDVEDPVVDDGLIVELTPYDAEKFLNLTGVRVE